MKKEFIHENFFTGHKNRISTVSYICRTASYYRLPLSYLAKRSCADRQFENMTQIWLAGDHYKWRAMRTCSVDEKYITGNASDWEKFEKWANTVPKTIRNPLFHWTHLELKRPFEFLI